MLKLLSTIITAGILAVSPATFARDDIETYVVGGVDTNILETPWQVYIQIIKNGIPYACGGTLVSRTWVVTAAHCLNSSDNDTDFIAVDNDSVTVFSGSADRSSSGNMKKNPVVKLVAHHLYNQSDDNSNDIALLQLSSIVLPPAQPIKLMDETLQVDADDEFDNGFINNLFLSGWGRTSTDGNESTDILQKTTLTGTSDANCAYEWYEIVDMFDHEDDFICANAVSKGSCNGDSGGPLIWQDKKSSSDADMGYRLAGVVSFGNSAQCAYDLYSDVYTQVSSNNDWIKAEIGNYQVPDPTFTADIFEVNFIPTEKKGGAFDSIYLLLLSLLLFVRRK